MDAVVLLPHALRWFAHPSDIHAAAAAAEARYRDARAAVLAGGSATDLVGAEAEVEEAFRNAAAEIASRLSPAARRPWRPLTYGLAVGWEVSLRAALMECLSSSTATGDAERSQMETSVSRFMCDAVQPALAKHASSPALFLLVASMHEYRRVASAGARTPPENALLSMHILLRSVRLNPDDNLARWALRARAALFMPADVEERLRMLDEYVRSMCT